MDTSGSKYDMEIDYLDPFPIWYKGIWKGEKAGGCQGVRWSADMRSRCEICRHSRKSRFKVLVCTDVTVLPSPPHTDGETQVISQREGQPAGICPKGRLFGSEAQQLAN